MQVLLLALLTGNPTQLRSQDFSLSDKLEWHRDFKLESTAIVVDLGGEQLNATASTPVKATLAASESLSWTNAPSQTASADCSARCDRVVSIAERTNEWSQSLDGKVASGIERGRGVLHGCRIVFCDQVARSVSKDAEGPNNSKPMLVGPGTPESGMTWEGPLDGWQVPEDLKVGTEWRIPVDPMRRFFRAGGNSAFKDDAGGDVPDPLAAIANDMSADVTAVLEGLSSHNGQLEAKIRVKGTVSGKQVFSEQQAPDVVTNVFKATVEGTGILDVASGRLTELTLEGTIEAQFKSASKSEGLSPSEPSSTTFSGGTISIRAKHRLLAR